MPEPRGVAKLAGEVVPGVYRFKMHNPQIDAESDGYVVVNRGRAVLIDPLPMKAQDLKRFGTVQAICLTASCHERAAWRYRKLFKVLVYAPIRAVDFDEKPDRWYKPKDRLPGGLFAVHSPGPTDAHYSFYLKRHGGVVFCADLLTHYGKGLEFVPGEYQDAPEETRESVLRLLDLRFKVLCSNHGAPITRRAKAAIRQALKRDAEQSQS
jgi:glyoxylase-like metal-dependent hydrolase (beta-lactamase superfamily II)